MGKQRLSGIAHKFGDDINTDYIIAGKYTKTLDYNLLAEHLFEDVAPEFAEIVQPGDIVVAGVNFGCGSSREQAALAIKHAGIGAVLACSFARIFFRNAINVGLPALVCDTERIAPGDRIEINISEGTVVNLETGERLRLQPLPPAMFAILCDGGLVAHLKKRGGFAPEE